MNNIPREQNSQHRLELLAAQRQLYSDVKNLQMISVVIGVPLVITWSILVAVIPKLAVYAGLWGIIATFLELLVFSRLQKSTQEKAAKIQQIFDCDVLQFSWASLNCGIRVAPELIVDASNRYKLKHQDYSALQNWYPISVGQLPIHLARIICQRSNIWWDAKLRRRYSKWIVFILIILTILVFLIGLVGGLTLEKFLLAVLAPLTPAFVLGLRQYTEHNEAANRLDRLRENAEIIVQKVISKKITQQEIEMESYSLQTQIYDNRRRSPLIFDWLYSQLRREDEEQMNKGAESLVQELTQNP
ncbi:MAG: S-4TM family putative pore-forming effector [Calothrix sp. MO_192.B10]|nr:S-4TM family putative pore-forming effector [Calothrix sp. MO_192.B10]